MAVEMSGALSRQRTAEVGGMVGRSLLNASSVMRVVEPSGAVGKAVMCLLYFCARRMTD